MPTVVTGDCTIVGWFGGVLTTQAGIGQRILVTDSIYRAIEGINLTLGNCRKNW